MPYLRSLLTVKLFAGLLIAFASPGCSDGSFQGEKSAQNEATAQTPASDTLKNADITKSPEKDVIEADDQVAGGRVEVSPPDKKEREAIGRCLAQWGQEQLPDDYAVRKVYASVTVGGKGVTLDDQLQTNTPVLTLVYAAVNVGGSPTWTLSNPNGWYCILVNVNVATELTVRLANNAKLADSLVNVNVDSEAEATSRIGINVGSTIRIERF